MKRLGLGLQHSFCCETTFPSLFHCSQPFLSHYKLLFFLKSEPKINYSDDDNIFMYFNVVLSLCARRPHPFVVEREKAESSFDRPFAKCLIVKFIGLWSLKLRVCLCLRNLWHFREMLA